MDAENLKALIVEWRKRVREWQEYVRYLGAKKTLSRLEVLNILADIRGNFPEDPNKSE